VEERERSAFGTLLRQFRLEAALSQEALAERARLAPESIGALERGARRSPYRETVVLLADALGLSEHDRRRLEAAAERPARPRLRALSASPSVGTPLSHPGGGVLQAPAGHNLPSELSSLIGREEAAAEIVEFLGAHRLVTLIGSGGTGKTRLALRVAESLIGAWSDGIWFVELAPLGQPSLVIGAVAEVLGVPTSPQRTQLESLVEFLRSRQLLLILDNCEHVLDAASNVTSAILRRSPGVKILATSREPMHISGERSYQVLPLEHPGQGSVTAAEAARYSAVELFVERAQGARNDFALCEDNAQSVIEICRRLNGIPLAIELAAARVRMVTPNELARMLDRRFSFLSRGDRLAPQRQQTMRATIDWSFDLLNAQQKVFARRLGIFAGGWTVETAVAVCSPLGFEEDAVFELLESLVDQSLVTVDFSGGTARYGFLESIRAYALEEMVAAGEFQMVAKSHAKWAANFGEWVAEREFYAKPDRWKRDWFGPAVMMEMANRREALEWALSTGGDDLLAGRIAGSPFWTTNEADERSLIEQALSRIGNAHGVGIQARLWLMLSRATRGERELTAARRAAELFETLGVRDHWVCSGLIALQDAFASTGQYLEALSTNELVLAVLGELRATAATNQMTALRSRAQILARLDRHDEARTCISEALAMSDHRAFRLPAVAILAEVEFRAGDITRAAAMTDAAAAEVPRSDWPHLLSWERNVMSANRKGAAAYRLLLGEVGAAREAALESLELERGSKGWTPRTGQAQHLATVAALMGDVRRAARIKGYVDAWYAAEEAWHERADERTYQMLVAAIRERLTDADLARLAAEGALLSEQEAVDMAVIASDPAGLHPPW
jgi:predicted ATPase/transcriptional regulator with XRE-family HTH domain